MSFLDFGLSVLNTKPKLEDSLWAGLGLAFAFVGAYFIYSALWPQFKATYKNKNTVGLNVPMFSFHTLVAFLFLVGSVCMIPAVKGLGPGDCYLTLCIGVVFTILNLFGFAGNYYVISLKFKNMRESKKLGLSEHEYYEKHVLPTLKA